MTDIKPIETVYNGYRFRSRLEARWAVFFDAAKIKYQYEPEGFERDFGDDGVIRYLPDFYLPDHDIYCEVKPNREKLIQDGEKLSWMVDFDGPMKNGLLILGQIPFVSEGNFPIFVMYSNEKALVAEAVTLTRNGIVTTSFDLFGNDLKYKSVTAPDFYYPKSINHYYQGSWNDLHIIRSSFPACFQGHVWCLADQEIPIDAYRQARQARFEHGESPTREIIKATTDINKEEVLKSFFDSFDELKDEIDF